MMVRSCKENETVIGKELKENTENVGDVIGSASGKESSLKRLRKRTKKRGVAPCTFIDKFVVESGSVSAFNDFELDEQILKVVGEHGWERPTLVQTQMIPLIFENKNILARARTGSGKTAAFMLPIIQKVLQVKRTCAVGEMVGPFVIFIVPSKELAKQTYLLLLSFIEKFPFLVAINFAEFDAKDQEDWLNEHPDFVVSTPSKFVHALKKYGKPIDSVRHVVLDEADLLLSFGYADEMRLIKSYLPKHHQTIFTSATMSENVSALKEIYMTGKVVSLKLKESQLPGGQQLSQYQISCRNDEERFAIFISLLKLNLVEGKTVIFVKDTERCYQLGLFLQAFGVRSCILNARMPVNSRCHVVEEYNNGRYQYLIASDINDVAIDQRNDEGNSESKVNRVKRPKRVKNHDKESGVGRGIDFHHVSNVINFDFPTSVDTYVHQVGRTARGFNKGTALSFVSPEERLNLEEVQSEMSSQEGSGTIVPYEIRIKDLESFVLRSREVLAACTKSAIREARLAEIRAEVLRSKRLESYFAKNSREKALLQHDKKLFSVSLHNPAIADVPDYMVPPSLRGSLKAVTAKACNIRERMHHRKRRVTVNQLKHRKKIRDPLQSFSL